MEFIGAFREYTYFFHFLLLSDRVACLPAPVHGACARAFLFVNFALPLPFLVAEFEALPSMVSSPLENA